MERREREGVVSHARGTTVCCVFFSCSSECAQLCARTVIISMGRVRVLDWRGRAGAGGAMPPPAVVATPAPPVPTARLSSGFDMPMIGLGTCAAALPPSLRKSAPGQVHAAVLAAVRAGYRHIDCASVYANEAEVGAALDELLRGGEVEREQLFITGKLWNSHHAPANVRPAVERTLRDLRLSFLDLYLIHWPVVTGCVGPLLKPSIAETWAAMEALVDAGLVRSIGVSNFSATKLDALLAAPGLRVRPAVLQVEAHPFWPNTALLEYARGAGLHVTAYSPLGSPDSAAIMQRGPGGPKLMEDPAVRALAAKHGRSEAQVLIRWSLQRGTSCLPKSSHEGRIRANLDVLSWTLDADDMHTLDTLPHRQRMVTGVMWLHPRGPYRTLAELWDNEDEVEPADEHTH